MQSTVKHMLNRPRKGSFWTTESRLLGRLSNMAIVSLCCTLLFIVGSAWGKLTWSMIIAHWAMTIFVFAFVVLPAGLGVILMLLVLPKAQMTPRFFVGMWLFCLLMTAAVVMVAKPYVEHMIQAEKTLADVRRLAIRAQSIEASAQQSSDPAATRKVLEKMTDDGLCKAAVLPESYCHQIKAY